MALPVSLYSTAQVRALDTYAIETLGIAGYTLMERAGEAALRCLRTRWPVAQHVTIVCGPGNNGGDGYVLARLARAAGLTVTVLAASPPDGLKGDAREASRAWLACGGESRPYESRLLEHDGIIVDALLGTGLHGPVREQMARVIHGINAAGRPVLALDVPSGLDSDTGMPLGAAVRADCTMTFVGLKTGLFVGDGPQFAGVVFFDDLGLRAPVVNPPPARIERIVETEIQRALPRRKRSAHKGDFGRVLIVGGGVGMPGAARLSGEACLRIGAGLVTVAVAPQNLPAVAAGRPELICLPWSEPGELREALERAELIAIGPGLGRSEWARAALHAVLGAGKPLVLDADALNLIAESGASAQSEWILTPHPGEAGRLLGISTAEVQRDRLGALERLTARYGGIVVLKGAGTLVGGPGRTPALCERGNPGMASAGMGDVLTGVIAGIFAQSRDAWLAARVGVLAHALAGDAAARNGERGLLAGDVIEELRRCIND